MKWKLLIYQITILKKLYGELKITPLTIDDIMKVNLTQDSEKWINMNQIRDPNKSTHQEHKHMLFDSNISF